MEFTFDEYRKIIDACKANGYQMSNYHDYSSYDKAVILRHDVDASLKIAAEMAHFEKELGVCSTYFVLPTTDLYNVNSKVSMDILRKMQMDGHEIGLHFDEKKYFASEEFWDEGQLIEYILKEKHVLETILDCEVTTVSMHTPSKKTLDADVKIPGMINSYGFEFFKGFKYVSDSYHRWRENVWNIIACGDYPRIQLLTHAIWYHEVYQSRSATFQQFIDEGREERYAIVEGSMLPPDTTLEESYAEDLDGMVGRWNYAHNEMEGYLC